MKKICLLFMMLLLSLGIEAAKVNQQVTLTVNNETRTYWLYVPDSYTANAPLVVSLHGAAGHSTDKSPFRTTVADSKGCIVVYPQGREIYFPVFGGKVTGWDASGEVNDDVAFIKAIIEDVAQKYTIDRSRIYCCGFSNGGMMTYALTNTCSDVFAAFASISGFPLNEFHLRHTSERPVPFLHIHGKGDDFVKYSLMPVIVDEMLARSGANPIPQKTTVTGLYDKSIYEAGEGAFPYVYYEVDGMGHQDYTDRTEDGNSALTMWKFFTQYTNADNCNRSLRWQPRTETEGFLPASHGWTVNQGTTLLAFGGEQNTGGNGNHNVYHSLQLDNGKYTMNFRAEGAAGTNVSVKLQKLTDNQRVVLEETVNTGEDANLTFQIEDGWGEYKLTITRERATDDILIKGLSLCLAEAPTPDQVLLPATEGKSDGQYYTLAGVRCPSAPTEKGLFIKDKKKYLIR